MTLLLPVQILKDSGTTGRKSYIQSHTHTHIHFVYQHNNNNNALFTRFTFI